MRTIAVALLISLGLVTLVSAQAPETPLNITQTYLRGRVTAILEAGEQTIADQTLPYQVVTVRIETGTEAGTELQIEHGRQFSLRNDQLVDVGERVVLLKTVSGEQTRYEILDTYRLPALGWLAAAVALLVLLIAGRRGALALAGLGVSLWLLIVWLAPQILHGASPFWLSLGGATVIAAVTMLLTHGFRRQTAVALGSTILSIIVATLLANRGVALGALFGFGSEEAYLFQFGPYAGLDFRGLLLAGMVFGALGVLDDVTTAQTATVDELARANKTLRPSELFERGMAVGRVHIASLVNTLALAYAGASFPLFLTLVIGTGQPLWVTANSEFLAEEIVRTLVGSAALLLAVPISTWVAARFLAHSPANEYKKSNTETLKGAA